MNPLSLFLRATLGLLAALSAATCADVPETPRTRPHDGPIVLVTVEGLRLDEIGGWGGPSGATPHLDRLIETASWSVTGVAASSWVAPAAASILTGLPPHQHRVLNPQRARLGKELTSLPEALKGLGYETHAHIGGPWLTADRGFRQGFDTFQALGRSKRAAGHLESLDGGRDFLWIHIADPQVPFVRRDWLSTGREPPRGLPERLTLRDLTPYRGGNFPLDGEERERILALYRLDVAWADELLGRLLTGLEASGHWEDSLLVVSGTHALELGDHGGILDGEHLGREVLEVPVVVKLPTGFDPPPALDGRIATTRLWATIVEIAGGRRAPAVAPSLFEDGAGPILSEHFDLAGRSELSILDGDLQLRQRSPEAPSLERWESGGGVSALDDPALRTLLGGSLTALWSEFVEEKPSPEHEDRQWTGVSPPGLPKPQP